MFEREAKIIDHREVAPGTFLATLREPSIAGQAEPGQFVMVRVQNGLDPLLRRPFSICGSAGDDAFHLLYRVVGRGTDILARRKAGDALQVLGPLGSGFRAENGVGPAFLVGGGMGVAPLFFLAQTLSGPRQRPFHFLAGFSSVTHVLDPAAILDTDVKIGIATDDGTLGHAGLVTDLLESRLQVEGSETPGMVFACGPLAMLKRVAELTAVSGIPCRVSLEAAMACGLGACLSCAVPGASDGPGSYHRVCREGPVFDAGAVDWKRMGGA